MHKRRVLLETGSGSKSTLLLCRFTTDFAWAVFLSKFWYRFRYHSYPLI